jgi:hypothetical protein
VCGGRGLATANAHLIRTSRSGSKQAINQSTSFGIVLRPRGSRGLADDLLLMKEAVVDVLLSTLPADEAAELGLADEAAACQRAEMSYLSYPIPD